MAGWNANIAGHPLERYYLDYKKRFWEDFGFMAYKYFNEMLARAIDKAGSADPAKVAKALEDLRYDGGVGEVWMRADDHQIVMPLYVSSFIRAGTAEVKYDADDTGYGWKPDVHIEAKDNILHDNVQDGKALKAVTGDGRTRYSFPRSRTGLAQAGLFNSNFPPWQKMTASRASESPARLPALAAIRSLL